MVEGKRSSLVKPSLDTPFHIDFSWWRQNDREWSVYLRSLLGPDYEEKLAGIKEDKEFDWVDPQTAEVQRVDATQHLLIAHFSQDQDLFEAGTSLVEGIFRVFLKNGNNPLSAQQLGESLNRPPQTILQTLSGPRVYRGLRPVSAKET